MPTELALQVALCNNSECHGLLLWDQIPSEIAWAAGVGATSARSARPPARRSSRPHAASASRCCPGKAAAVVYRSARLTSRKRAREAHQDLRNVKSNRVSEARDTKCNHVNQLQLNTNTTNNRNFGKYLPKLEDADKKVRTFVPLAACPRLPQKGNLKNPSQPANVPETLQFSIFFRVCQSGLTSAPKMEPAPKI